MTSPAPETGPRRVRLRTMLAVSTMLPTAAAVLLTGWLSLRNGERAVDNVVHDLQIEVADGAATALRQTLEPPHLLNALNADQRDGDELQLDDPDWMQRHFLRQLRRFDSIGYVQFGYATGHFVGVERATDGFRVERTDPALRGKTVWHLDDAGDLAGDPIADVPGYDARKRPWFRAAADAGTPTWSAIYQFSSRETARLGVTAVQPQYDADGLVGVWGADIVLSQLGHLLASERLRTGGRVFVIERDGVLVAHTAVDPPFRVDADNKAERLPASRCGDPLTEQVVAAVTAGRSLTAIDAPLDLSIPVAGDIAFVRVAPFRDGRGVDWLLFVVLPRSDFAAEIRKNTRATAALLALGLVGALALGLVVSRRVSRPVLALSDAARALADGRWDLPVPDPPTAELGELADAFERMRADLQHHQQALANTAQEALDAQARAEAANQAKSAFLANMSHELRTPLNAILGYADLLDESDTLDPTARADLQRIRTAGGHLLGLIADVLDLSRIEAGYLDLVLARIDAGDPARAAVDTTRGLIEGGGNRVELVVDPSAGELTTDVIKLRQCLVNLLGNAAKFTEGGRVRVEVEGAPREVVYRVIDSGVGIAPERLASVFAPFSQIDPSTTRRRDGAGLGLAITREFARALGGEVTVDSAPGRGSTFTIRVPRAGPARRATTPGPPRRT